MTYFRKTRNVSYKFGDETSTVDFPNIAAYTDVIDKLKANTNLYTKYSIQEGDRPDQVSSLLYEDHQYYWTFFLLNDHVRRSGWPLSNSELLLKAQDLYPNTTLVVRSILTDTFPTGTTIQGNASGVSAKILRKNIDLGQIVVEGSKAFQAGETIRYTDAEGTVITDTVYSKSAEYLSAHHYEEDEEYVDIDPESGPGALLTEKTYFDRLSDANEELKSINVIKPESIYTIAQIFYSAMASE